MKTEDQWKTELEKKLIITPETKRADSMATLTCPVCLAAKESIAIRGNAGMKKRVVDTILNHIKNQHPDRVKI